MKKNYGIRMLALLTAALTVNPVCMHAQQVYSTTLDNTGFVADADLVNGASLTFDGGVIAAGQINNNLSGKAWGPGLVTKLDPNGSPEWWMGLESYHPDSVTVAGNDLRFFDAIQDAGGSYVISGQYSIAGRDKSDGILLKIKPDGNIQWFKRYNLDALHSPGIIMSDLAQLPNGRYVGTGLAGEGHNKGGWLWFRSDVNGGNPIIKTYWHEKRSQGVKVLPQADNSSVVAWYSGTNGTDGDIYPVFSKVDVNGNLLSEKWVVLDYNAILTDCIQTSDGGFAAIGCGVSESFLLKLDANLEVAWIKSWPIGGAATGDLIRTTFASITQLASGNYYISGAYYPTLVGTVYENLIVVTDNNGNILSARSINQGTSTQEAVQKSIALPDGRIMSLGNVITSSTVSDISVFHDNAAGVTACTATTLSIAPTASGVLFDKDKPLISPVVYTAVVSKDTLVIKTSYNQTTICPPLDMGLKAEAGSIKIYPNPVSETLLISLPDQDFDMNYELFITGIEGRLILKKTLTEISSEVNVNSWPAGLYTYRLQAADGSQVKGIFIKQ